MASSEPDYANIRNFLGHLVGKTLVDVTQHDEDEYLETQESYVMLLFDCGDTVKFPISDAGFCFTREGEEVPVEPYDEDANDDGEGS